MYRQRTSSITASPVIQPMTKCSRLLRCLGEATGMLVRHMLLTGETKKQRVYAAAEKVAQGQCKALVCRVPKRYSYVVVAVLHHAQHSEPRLG